MRVTENFLKRCPRSGKIIGVKTPKGIFKLLLLLVGFLSLIWFLIRVIPKPSRANYPCMRATMPLAYSFIAYIIALSGSFLFFRKAYRGIRRGKFHIAFTAIFIGVLLTSIVMVKNTVEANAIITNGPIDKFTDPLGPNAPIGEPKGIFPGRVIWTYNANATNENCTNNNYADAYWIETNTNQDTVDKMLSDAILEITGEETLPEAWDAIFRYFNEQHGKPDTGYVDTETIFLKINAVTAWSGALSNGDMPGGTSIEFDTSPQAILAMLRQLINYAGVPQEKIFVGDPMCDIFNTLYNKFHAEFPDVNYTSQGDITGRYKLTPDDEAGIIYSDKGTVMTEVTSHTFFNEMMDAEYMVNIPSLKGHRWGGVTMFAKNYFGCNTADHSWELHKGLMKPDSDPLRDQYESYRVFVDLMSDKDLGGKSLIYFMDALWATSYEHQKPQKFNTYPFNKDWCSSILLSLDPVAIESVGLDILQKEFTEADNSVSPPRYTYVQWNAVDDYLHQAADSSWWPEGILYDPDTTGTPISSLGVHEHWNHVDSMQYSRDLGTGEGIELIKHFYGVHEVPVEPIALNDFEKATSFSIYPNPANREVTVTIESDGNKDYMLEVLSVNGDKILSTSVEDRKGSTIMLNVENWQKGIYFCTIKMGEVIYTEKLLVY